ncbi:MAG: hypothetical protein KatS3mg077_1752 [Candidatus Binatia bacterium]|nr:MAG: hypothetical protein KatS3mg077_1752 [Candidatus Binatia bacterium]
MRGMEKWLVAGLALAMSMSSCTCERALPPVPEPPHSGFAEREGAVVTASPPAQVAKATPTPKVERAAESPTPAAVSLPEDFPADVPIYAGAKLEQVHDLPNNAHNVIFRAEGSVEDINRFYHEKLSQAGWNVTQQFARPNHAFMTYKKGNLIANVTIAEDARDPNQRVIAIMYEEEQPLPFEEF